MKANIVQKRKPKISLMRRSSRNKFRLLSRRHGPIKIYTAAEVRAFNIMRVRGLI